ncbi:MAG: hypothetical protein IKP40_09250 [Clostridia bacterium]|nr:hypothetical protein [Clostridia bacterium]
MDGRYTPARNRRPVRRSVGSRLRGILILAVLAAAVTVLILSLPALRYRQEAEDYFGARMLTECDAAVGQLNKLSRTASGSSYTVLSEIRSRVYAADILNQTCVSLGGRQVVDQSAFDAVYTIVESYNANLLVGAMTANLQSELTNTLTGLRDQVAATR